MVINIAKSTLRTQYGAFQEYLYYDGQKELIALVMGEVEGREHVLCRVHSSCIAAHAFNSIECDCREQMAAAQEMIQAAGSGVIIWLEQEGKSNGHFALLQSKSFKEQGFSQSEAYAAVGFKNDARDFSRAAEVLKDLGVQSIQMMTNNPEKIDTLTKHGVEVTGTKSLVIDPIH
jgi:GTP cyclohydrolase II